MIVANALLSTNFQKVCAHHGGRAKQSVQAARRRMMEQADPAVRQLQKIAFDDTAPIETRLKATLAIIDRTGLGPRSSVDVELTARPFEQVLDGFIEMDSGGSRSDFRRSMGIEDDEPPAALPRGGDDETIDVEIIDEQESS